MLRNLLLLLLPLIACNGGTEGNGPELPAAAEEEENSVQPGDPDNKGIIRCFAYHRFGNDEYPSTNISLDRFEAHLRFLKENDYEVLTLGEAMDRLNSEESVPEKTAVLSMDDGYKSVKTGALPLLNEYGYKATIFVCTEYVGGKNNLSWKELEELQEEGHEIGNHSHSHEHFLNTKEEQRVEGFKEDLERSEDRFEEHLGEKPETYAYPYGEYDPSLEQALEGEGYKAAVAQKSGVIHSGSGRFRLPRFPMTSYYGEIGKFKDKARMHPLRVLDAEPASPVVKSDAPPELKLKLQGDELNTDGFRCFVDGSDKCVVRTERNGESLELRVRSEKKLSDRRTLYTVTVPSEDGRRWHWYSHLWVDPTRKE